MDRFVVATAILDAYGGTREAAWTLAGQLIDEGMSARSIFVGLVDDSEVGRRYRNALELRAGARTAAVDR